MEKAKPDERSRKYHRGEYISRINRVIDYIESHYEEPLQLEDLADVASFSPFHFHRIFKALVGETLNRFINRIRIEKTAAKLIDNPNKSITEIAFDYGFSGSAVEGEVGKMMVLGGKFAVGRFEIAADEYGEAWDMVAGGWLPESGYQPGDGPCYEIYQNDPKTHPENLHIVDICMPVKPL